MLMAADRKGLRLGTQVSLSGTDCVCEVAIGTCQETIQIPSACVECLRIVREAGVIAEVDRGQEAWHMVLTFSQLGS